MQCLHFLQSSVLLGGKPHEHNDKLKTFSGLCPLQGQLEEAGKCTELLCPGPAALRGAAA